MRNVILLVLLKTLPTVLEKVVELGRGEKARRTVKRVVEIILKRMKTLAWNRVIAMGTE